MIRYAEAGVDELGHHVTCPECGVRCYGGGTDEDAVTKSSGVEYGEHFAKEHARG